MSSFKIISQTPISYNDDSRASYLNFLVHDSDILYQHKFRLDDLVDAVASKTLTKHQVTYLKGVCLNTENFKFVFVKGEATEEGKVKDESITDEDGNKRD